MHQPPAPPRAWRAAIVTVLLCLTSAAGAQADPISPPPALCKVPAAGTKLTAVFQPQVAIRDLATWFYSFSCKKLLFASDLGELSAQVTMIGSGRMTVKQATALFENALTAAGLKRTIKGDTWIITRDPKATSCAPAAPSLSAQDVLAIDTTSAEARKANGIVAVDETHYTITRASFARLFDERSQPARGWCRSPATARPRAFGSTPFARPRSSRA